MSSSSFPLDPAASIEDLRVVFSNADRFALFEVPRVFVTSVGATLEASGKSRYLFLFEDVLLITKYASHDALVAFFFFFLSFSFRCVWRSHCLRGSADRMIH